MMNPQAMLEEDQRPALEKYGRDLTALAQAGKLDPVIGRGEEIRRTIQVLSSRRLIQREIQDRLALDLLQGRFKTGGAVAIPVDKKTGEFIFF